MPTIEGFKRTLEGILKADPDMPLKQVLICLSIDLKDGTPRPHIQSQLRLEAWNMHRHLTSLEKKGFINNAPDVSDPKVKRAFLTHEDVKLVELIGRTIRG